jgi:hypothetical protein
VQQPEVWLAGARLGSIGFTGGVVKVRLSVYNPNRFAFRASGLTYDLDLEDPDGNGWLDFTEGRLDRRLEVEARDTVEVEIPVEFEYRGWGGAARAPGPGVVRLPGERDRGPRGPGPARLQLPHAGAVTPSGDSEPHDRGRRAR